jgi:hypothetical protein
MFFAFFPKYAGSPLQNMAGTCYNVAGGRAPAKPEKLADCPVFLFFIIII